MSVETRLCQLEEQVKLLEEKMEYVWMGFEHFIRSVAKAKSKLEENHGSEQTPNQKVKNDV